METEQKAIKQSFDLQQQTLQNESAILACLRIYNSLNTELSSFETLLFDHAANIPRQLFKHFRKISELIETSFSTLEGYISFNPSYIQEKDKILQEQISLMEEQITKKKSTQFTESDGFKQKSGTKSSFEIFKKTQESNDPRQLEFLRQEIETLQNELRKNDSEYEIQIKKYNTKYQELQEEIDYYKDEMNKLGEYAEAVEKLEIQLRIMKEMRDRDECLIQNMARKLRNAEREKSHNFAFVSPSKQNFLSPSRMSYNLQPKNYFSSKYE